MTLPLNPIIDAAQRKADAEYDLYRVERLSAGKWNVTRYNDASRDYIVEANGETYNWTCDCPAYEKTQTVCKHVFIVRMREEEWAADEDRANAYDHDAPHCLAAGKF